MRRNSFFETVKVVASATVTIVAAVVIALLWGINTDMIVASIGIATVIYLLGAGLRYLWKNRHDGFGGPRTPPPAI